MAKSELTHQNITVGDCSLHTVEAGNNHPDSVVFLHGWPEDLDGMAADHGTRRQNAPCRCF